MKHQVKTNEKPLARLSTAELLTAYGKTLLALYQYADAQRDCADYRNLLGQRVDLESEAKRRDTNQLLPAQPKRGEDWDLYA